MSYRIYQSASTNKIIIIEIDSDEYEYEQTRFLNDEYYSTKEEAYDYLAELYGQHGKGVFEELFDAEELFQVFKRVIR